MTPDARSTHRPWTQSFLNIRGLRYAVRQWPAEAPPSHTLFLLHGWMDSSPTFQFLADALPRDWQLLAPDWRGYGQSQYLGQPYWFPDYYADLDALLDILSPNTPAHLVGHSMGASVASFYAAARPERVGALAMLDFLGLHPTQPEDSPTQIQTWLQALNTRPRLSSYGECGALATRLLRSNPRLSPERADFLARHVSRLRPDGRIEMACDPWHKVAGPIRYHLEDVLAAWRAIRCPTLHLVAEEGYVMARFGEGSAARFLRETCFVHRTVHVLPACGHNLHHDQPEETARHLVEFFRPHGMEPDA